MKRGTIQRSNVLDSPSVMTLKIDISS